MIAAILSAYAALAAPSGEVAFVATPPSAPSRVHIVAIGSRHSRVIGPEGALGPIAWSPDGRRLAFAVRESGGSSRIFVADAGNGEGEYLNHAQAVNRDPVWSPDGLRIAYAAGAGLDTQVMVATLDSRGEQPWGGGRTSLGSPVWTTLRVLDRFFARVGDDDRPRFLPAIGSTGPPRYVLLAVGFAGGAERTTDLFLLTESEATALDAQLMPSAGAYEESAPSVSSNGIAFDSNDGGDRDIFVIGRRRTWDASNHPAADWRPVWSPDGQWLVFESFRGGTQGLYRLPKISTRTLRIASERDADCWGASWSPDSQWIAYTTNKSGTPEIWAVGVDGNDRVRVSPEDLPAAHAAWRPVP